MAKHQKTFTQNEAFALQDTLKEWDSVISQQYDAMYEKYFEMDDSDQAKFILKSSINHISDMQDTLYELIEKLNWFTTN